MSRALPLLLYLLNGCMNIESDTAQSGGSNNSSCGVTMTDNEFEVNYAVRCMEQINLSTPAENENFGPNNAIGAPTGAGLNAGSLDVFVIGRQKSAWLWHETAKAINENGPDVVVYENGFKYSGGVFRDLGWLEVSNGGASSDPDQWEWYSWQLPVNFTASLIESTDNLVGKNTVNVNKSCDPTNPREQSAGGDLFDLSQAKKITSRGDGNPLNFVFGETLNTDTTPIKYFRVYDGGDYLEDGTETSVDNGIDIDAICILNYSDSQ